MNLGSIISTTITYGGPAILSGLLTGLFCRHVAICTSEKKKVDEQLIRDQALANKDIVSRIVSYFSDKERGYFLFRISKDLILILKNYVENTFLVPLSLKKELNLFSKCLHLYKLFISIGITNLNDSEIVINLLEDKLYSNLLNLTKTLILMRYELIQSTSVEGKSWEKLLSLFKSKDKTTNFSLDFRPMIQSSLRESHRISGFSKLETIYFGKDLAMDLAITDNPELSELCFANVFGFIDLKNLPRLLSINIKDLENLDTCKIKDIKNGAFSSTLAIGDLEELKEIKINTVNYACMIELRRTSHPSLISFPALTSFSCENWVSFHGLDFTQCPNLEKASIKSVKNSGNPNYPTTFSIDLAPGNKVCVSFEYIESEVDINFDESLPRELTFKEDKIANVELLEKFKKWSGEILKNVG